MARASVLLPLAALLGCATPPPAPRPGPPAQQCRDAAETARIALTRTGYMAPTLPWCGDDPCARPEVMAQLVDDTPPTLTGWTAGKTATDATRPALERAARAYNRLCGMAEAEALTAELVRFPTVSAREPAATGPAFAAMASHLEAWSKARGFGFEATKGNGAWVVSAGEGAPGIGFVMHADVVPVDKEDAAPTEGLPSGWSHPPFEMTAVGDRLYGRGTEDDKGPIAAVLVSMHTLARFGLLPAGQLQAIMGTGEEHDWSGMRAYIESRPQPPHVISLDASYPVVVAESGFVAWTLEHPIVTKKAKGPKGCVEAEHVEAGQFLTQVPGEGRLVLTAQPGLVDRVKAAAQAGLERLKDERLGFEVAEAEGRVTLVTRGEAVHSSEADVGANALWVLAAASRELKLCPGAIRETLRVLDGHFAGDHWGKRLGVAYAHPLMGKLLVIPTVLRTEDTKVVLRVNMRRPAGASKAEFEAGLDTALKTLQATAPELSEAAKGRYVGEPALVEPDAPLVKTLMSVYRDLTGDATAKPKSIRGGTYARLFPAAVSFGPALPGRAYRGHAPDEYLERDALELMLRSCIEAVLRLDPGPTTLSER